MGDKTYLCRAVRLEIRDGGETLTATVVVGGEPQFVLATVSKRVIDLHPEQWGAWKAFVTGAFTAVVNSAAAELGLPEVVGMRELPAEILPPSKN